MAKRAKTEGSAFNPVADSLVRAVTSPQPRIVTGYQDESEGLEPLSREKRVLLTPSEERDLNTFLLELGAALGTQVQLSHLLRSAIELLKHARGEILEEARQTPGLHRPANVYRIAMATFERRLARLLLAAFRGSPPLA
jgi:hypothetical protein